MGVEITPDAIHMLQVRRHGGRCERVAWVREPFEPFAAGYWWQDPDRIEAALRSAHRRSGTRQRRVAVALPASQVICKLCHLPGQTAEQMEAQLLADADTLFPFPLDDLAIDFHVMSASEGRSGYRDVMVAACRQSTLQPLEAVFEAAGLQLAAVEVDSIALRRLLPAQPFTGASALLRLEPDGITLHGWMQDGLPQRRELPAQASVEELAEWVADGLQPAEVLVCGTARGERGRLDELGHQLKVPCRTLPAVAGLDCNDCSLACALALGGLR